MVREKEKREIYVIGGNGRIGREIVRVLNAIPIVRKRKNANEVEAKSEEEYRKVLSDAEVVINAAGSLSFNDPISLYNGNVKLVEYLVNAMPESCVFIHISSISVYGKRDYQNANENFSVHPDTIYAKTKYLGEKVALLHKKTRIIRAGVVYGEQFSEYAKMLKLIKRGILPIFGNGRNIIPFVHVRDIANLCEKLIERPVKIVNAVENTTLTQEKILEYASSILSPTFRFKLYFKGPLLSLLKSIGYSEMVETLSRHRHFDNSLFLSLIKPIQLREGIKNLVEDMRRKNIL